MGNLLTLGLSTASLLQNTEYKLAAGNGWNGISAQSNSLEYYNAVFSADNDGLRVKFSLKDANTIWMGDELNTSWSGSKFGPDTRVPGESETAVFNDLAESRNVQVQGQQCAAKLLFDSTKEYTVAGTLVVDTGSSNMALNTDVIGYDGAVGTVEKIGNNTLTVKSGLLVDTLAVKEGRVEIRDSGILMDFLANTRSLETMNGGYAMLGGNAFTLESDEYKTNLVVGNRSTIELALGQHSTKTFQGGLSMADGATLKLFDGGLQINGDISLGSNAGDRVTLQGNWGEAGSNAKAGIILAGEVSGSGTVVLTKDSNSKDQRVTLTNNGNTFNGTYEVNDKTSLVVGADSAIKDASVNMKGGSLLIRADVSAKSLTSESGKGLVQIEESKSLALQHANYSGQIKLADDVTISSHVADGVVQLSGGVRLESQEAGKASVIGTEGTRLENSLVELVQSTRLELEHLTLTDSSKLKGADGNAVMVNHVTFDTTIGVNASLTPASAPVLLTAGTGDTPTLAAENRPSAVLTLSNAENVTLTGTDLTLNLSGISYEELISYGIVGIAVGGNNGSFDEQLNVAVRWGEQQANTYHQNNDGMVYFNTDDLTNVPEPTTGTLSLLALAALCSRRRRKG